MRKKKKERGFSWEHNNIKKELSCIISWRRNKVSNRGDFLVVDQFPYLRGNLEDSIKYYTSTNTKVKLVTDLIQNHLLNIIYKNLNLRWNIKVLFLFFYFFFIFNCIITQLTTSKISIMLFNLINVFVKKLSKMWNNLQNKQARTNFPYKSVLY